MVTICLPLARDVPVAVVNKALDKLGNPARRSPLPQAGLADALDRTGIVHFAHMTAVEGKTGARGSDFLIVELSADGPAEDAVVAFFEAGKSWLMPVLTLATNVSSEPEIRHLLVKNIRRLVAGRILPRRTTASGLNFVGTPELSVERIEREAGLATEVRARLEDCMTLPGAATAPAMTILRHVRESVRRGPLREGLARPRSQKLGLSHRANRTFQEAFGALLADWRFSGKFVIGTLVLLAVFHAATHGVRSWGDAGQAVTLLARIAASLAIGGGATIAAAAVLHRATPGEAGKPAAPLQSWLASHIAGVAILTILFAFLHFVLFQTTVHEAAWDGEPIDVRAALAVTTLVDILVTAAVGLLLLGLLVGVAIAIVLFFLRRSETTSPVEDFDPPFDRVKELLHRENPPGHVQNHIIAVTPLKTDPRWLRRMTLGLAFWGIEKMVQHQFRPGFVLDLGTIHFARWFRLPGTDKLAFLSNYSGSWESYLEDFITKAHGGQTAVWSNGVGFPETRFLLQGGAEHGAKFKRWVRRQQVETRFWYSRFPALTTSQMRANALICEGLAKACTVNDAQAWLDLFGSRPRPSGLLDFEEIQALVFNGMGRQRSAELLPVRIPEGSEGWREWLRALAGETGSVSTLFQAAAASPDAVAFGEAPPKERAACVAFSAEGLRRMGLDRISYHQAGAPASTSLGSFPQAFVDGMASEERARILGDAGEGHPSKWRWYAEATPHAVLLLYASDRTSLDAYAADVRKRLTGTYGLNVLAPIRMQDLPENLDELREPFGFHDGVSQPIMRGTRRFHDSVNAMHAVEPGEFILGYPDNRGDIPPSPVVDDTYDDDILPDLVANLPSRFPDFRGERAAAPRDLGRNGSFLVIRQLEQNVAGFNAHADRLAAQLQPAFPNENITRDWVTARMVGRWQDGSSLARHPSAPGGAPDNDFLFGADDPQGNRCPYGAHIRRAFPRDSLNPEHKQQLEISNRHRILRRGRAYEAWEGEDRSEGLVFMALNADIERQFEFVQQTWISSPTFHDVSEEIDPIATGRTQTEASSGGGAFTIQSSAGPVTLRNIQSFVTVKNGGYFFLPSRSALRFLATLPK
jgi:deferrochelatase/peroxidase EfeB